MDEPQERSVANDGIRLTEVGEPMCEEDLIGTGGVEASQELARAGGSLVCSSCVAGLLRGKQMMRRTINAMRNFQATVMRDLHCK